MRHALFPLQLVDIERLDIPIFIERVEARIRHPDLFPLIDIRCPLKAMEHGREHLRTLDAVVRVVPETADDTRLVMVAPEDGVPSLPVHPLLPRRHDVFQLNEIERCSDELLPVRIVDFQVVEAERHAELVLVRV